VRKIKCRATRVFGKVKLRGASRSMATISRGRVRYAIGTSVTPRRGRLRILVTELRPLTRGAYALTLRRRHGHRLVVRRMSIALG
jgi:hypothetical protein